MGQARQLNPRARAIGVRKQWAAFVVVALLGLLIRLPQLGSRPMHTDEAVNAYIVGQLLAGKSFIYDPVDRHGPALAALALPLARMQGAKAFADLTEFQLRLSSVMAGTATILLFGAAAQLFGSVPCLIAALLFAASPLPVYYDRFFIHESLFVALTFALILAGIHALTRGTVAAASLAAACAALMLACKETAVLHFIALAAAALVYWQWNLRGKALLSILRPKPLLAAAGVFVLVSLMLFTWHGSNWKSIPNLLQAAPNLFLRAGGQGHQKPLWYYAGLLCGGWSGAMIVALAMIGFVQTIRRRDPSPFDFLALYGFFVALTYCLIPYKTPWLALNLWLPISLFAGLALKLLWNLSNAHPALRILIPALCILVAALTAHDTRQRAFLKPADEANPYAYAQTSEDILGLSDELARLAQLNAIANPRIAVIASDPWPLPWYLRHSSQVGFWQPGEQPGTADFYITSTEVASQYPDQFKNFRAEFFGVRPGVLILLWMPLPR